MSAPEVARLIGLIHEAMWLPRIASWEIAQTDGKWGAHGELDADDSVAAVMALTKLASEVGSELADKGRLLTVDFTQRQVPVRVWWLRPVVPVAHATAPVLLTELAQAEHELTGARLSLWEEEQDSRRLRLALQSAQRGRREQRTRAARYRIAWRMARTRAVSVGGAADRAGTRVRELLPALQEAVFATIAMQMERDAARDEAARLRLALKSARRGRAVARTEVAVLKAEARTADRDLGQVIDERDRMHDVADRLAYAVAPLEAIGEHSSENDPWANALDLITPHAQVKQLQERVTELEAERHSTNEALDDAVKAQRTGRKAVIEEAAAWLAEVGQKDAAYLLRTCDIEAGESA